MAEPRKNSLLQFPGINVASLQHVAAVVRLHHDRGATAQLFGHQCGDVAEIHQRRDLYALVSRSESEIVDRIVGNREWVKIDLADPEVFAGFNLLDAIAKRAARFCGSSSLTLKRSLIYASQVFAEM